MWIWSRKTLQYVSYWGLHHVLNFGKKFINNVIYIQNLKHILIYKSPTIDLLMNIYYAL